MHRNASTVKGFGVLTNTRGSSLRQFDAGLGHGACSFWAVFSENASAVPSVNDGTAESGGSPCSDSGRLAKWIS